MWPRLSSWLASYPESAYQPSLFRSCVTVAFWFLCAFFAGVFALAVVLIIQN